MGYLLGFDIGTSAVKGVLMSYDGKIKTVKTKKSTYYFENGMKLMDAESFIENCFDVIKEISLELEDDESISAMCISGAGGNLMFAKDEKSCSPIFGWQTKFPAEETEKTLSGLSRDDVYKTVGWPKLQGFPMAGIAYFKAVNPKLLEDSEKICMHIEYLNYRLTGAWGVTRSMGTTFFLIDQEKGKYSEEYLKLLGIDEDKLMPVVDNCTVIGKISGEAAKRTGLKEGTPVIAGSFDHPAAARGAGVINENEVMVSCGTSWVVFVPYAERKIPQEKGMLTDPFMAPNGNWCGMKSLSSVSETIEKLKKVYLGEVTYSEFDELAKKAPAGCNGLIIEDENADITGYTRSDIARAIAECIGRKLKVFFDDLDIKAETVKFVGGITNSKVWCDIVSEVIGKKITVVNGEHAGAVGSAIMAGIGIGVYKDEKDALEKLNLK